MSELWSKLTDAELIRCGKEWISDLCNGRRQWTMHVPARVDEDSDLVLSELIHRFERLLSPPATVPPSGEDTPIKIKKIPPRYEPTL